MPEGRVIRQFPADPGDPVEPGTEITLFISSGFPDDAVRTTKTIEVEPKEPGEISTVRVFYQDARGDRQEWGSREISGPEVLQVEVVVTPETDAIITYYVDGDFGDSFTITHKDALKRNENPEEDSPGIFRK